MSFWTDDINSEEVLSPYVIMTEAGNELAERTGVLTVEIVESILSDRVSINFEVKNVRSGVSMVLFKTIHQKDAVYPALIEPIADELPNYLHKKKFIPGTPSAFEGFGPSTTMLKMLQGTPGTWVEQEWLCATPKEFNNKLKELFHKEYIKSLIISLLATDTATHHKVGTKNGVEEGEDNNENDGE